MKPDLYVQYHQVYDRFSSVKLFPIFLNFCHLIQRHSAQNTSSIADVGAGTALFTSLLQQYFSDADISVIEPSIYMMPYAKNRMSGEKTHFYQSSLEQALDQLSLQDVFIFQRSLYSLSGDINYYKNLSTQLANKTSANGIIAIFEIGQLYDVAAMHDFFYTNRKVIRLSESEFEKQWSIFERALYDFNQGVKNGDYMLFNKTNLNEIFSRQFSLIDGNDSNIFIYQKK